MKIDDHNAILEKSKTRNNGVYSHKEYLYAVINNKPVAYADWFGNLSLFGGSFHVSAGKCDRHERRKTLLAHIKSNLK